MRRLLSISTLLLATIPAPAAVTVTIYPAAKSVPLKTYQTFSAKVEGTATLTGTWSVSGGTMIGNTVCTSATSSLCTIAVYSATAAGPITVTFTSADAGHATGTASLTFTATPTPLTTHPRLMMNTSDLATLQAKFAADYTIPGSPSYALYQNAVSMAATDDVAMGTGSGGGGYNGGNASAGCPGGGGGTGLPNSTYIASELAWGHAPEFNDILYAFLANVDNTSPEHTHWSCRAHDWYIYVMQEVRGVLPGENTVTCTCLGNAHIANGNRGSTWAEGPGLELDWVYSTYTSSDFSTNIVPALKQFSTWTILNTGGLSTSIPTPTGTVNSPTLLQTSSSNAYGYVRSFLNNYGLFFIGAEAAIGMAIDAADDPSSAHCSGGFDTVCTDGTPNSVRAMFHYATDAWGYLDYLNLEDPAVSTAALNAAFGSTLAPGDQCNSNAFGNPTPLSATMPCYGNERGGLSHEGTLYLGWFSHMATMGLMLQSSGYNDPTGRPQISFFTSSWWDEYAQGLQHILTPAIYTVSSTNFQNYFAYGPNNTTYDQIFFIAQVPMLLYDQDLRTLGASTYRSNALGWLSGNMNIEFTTLQNVSQNTISGVSLFLMQLSGSTPFSGFTDPRPTMPTSFYSYNAGNLIASSGAWSSTTGGVFRTYCPRFPMPNHEEGYCSTFDLYYKGDWVTKGIYSYALSDGSLYGVGEQPDTGNMSAYGNTPANLPNPTGQYYIDPFATRGGRVNNGWPTGQTINDEWSDFTTYTSDHLDSTGQMNLFGPGNGRGGNVSSQDITSSTTDFIWLKPGVLASGTAVIRYDRGNTGTASFKRMFFMSTGAPTITSNVASWHSSLNTTSDYLTSLLQPNANMAIIPVYPFAQAIASGDYAAATGSSIVIDAGAILTATETYTTATCSSTPFLTGAVCPSHLANYLANLGATGGVSCGTLTQVADYATPGSCQYSVQTWGGYSFNAADVTAGVTIHYSYSTPVTSMRSLNVVEAQNVGTSSLGPTLVQSTSGQGFDCAKVGTTLSCFIQTLATFTGTTYPASGATTHYVSNLTPNTSYPITGTGAPANATTDQNGVLTFAATGTGNIVIGSGSPPPSAPTNLQGVVLQGVSVQ